MPNIRIKKKSIIEKPAPAFTLIEVLIALAVVGISLLALFRLNINSIAMARNAETTSQAVLLAQQKIAETAAPGYPKVATDSGVVKNNSLDMHWRTEVTEMPSYSTNAVAVKGLRRISVDVSWRQGIGLKHLKMSTCVADRKLP